MTVHNGKCPFCSSDAKYWDIKDTSGYYGYDCPICKIFNITHKCLQRIEGNKDNYTLLNCISENIYTNPKSGDSLYSWHHEQDTSQPRGVTVKILEQYLAIPISHADKATNILLLIARKLRHRSPVMPVKLSQTDIFQLKIKDAGELSAWVLNLRARDLISFQAWSGSFDNIANMLSSLDFTISPTGWHQIAELEKGKATKKVFIAMQFNWGNDLKDSNTKYLDAVREGCRRCGFEANIVSDGHTGPILDKILAEIRTSDFMIVDFTFNNRGAYFEAGYGRALGIPVIHTVMEGHSEDPNDQQKRLHFDIQQINYIKWSDPAELADRIESRIKAVIDLA